MSKSIQAKLHLTLAVALVAVGGLAAPTVAHAQITIAQATAAKPAMERDAAAAENIKNVLASVQKVRKEAEAATGPARLPPEQEVNDVLLEVEQRLDQLDQQKYENVLYDIRESIKVTMRTVEKENVDAAALVEALRKVELDLMELQKATG